MTRLEDALANASAGGPLPVLDVMNTFNRFAALSTMMNGSAIAQGPFKGNDSLWWGLQLQHQWQADSGRLMLNGAQINPQSWWGAMNYYLSVVPYMGGMQAGVLPKVTIKLPKGPDGKDDPRYIPSPAIVKAWADVFKEIETFRTWMVNYDPSCGLEAELRVDKIYYLMWQAHIVSLEDARPKFNPLLGAIFAGGFGQQEGYFALGWSNFVHFVAATRFRTDYDTIQSLQTALPTRNLPMKNMSPLQQAMVEQLRTLGLAVMADERVITAMRGIWDKANATYMMRTQNRKDMQNALKDPEAFRRLIMKVLAAIMVTQIVLPGNARARPRVRPFARDGGVAPRLPDGVRGGGHRSVMARPSFPR